MITKIFKTYVFLKNLGLSQRKFIVPRKSWLFPEKQSCPGGERT
jgi:hypothetical protein